MTVEKTHAILLRPMVSGRLSSQARQEEIIHSYNHSTTTTTVATHTLLSLSVYHILYISISGLDQVAGGLRVV